MWSKGAVVVIKRGDKEMADAIVDGLDIQLASPEELENLRRDNTFLKRRTAKDIQKKIEEAEELYGYNWTPPKWARWFFDFVALIEYGVAVFVDKYLIIKDERE